MKQIFTSLRDTSSDRREEEINKFLIKKVLRFILKEDIEGDGPKAIRLYQKYFRSVMDEKEFNLLFIMTDE